MAQAHASGSRSFPVIRLHGNEATYGPDDVALEEPLEITLHYGPGLSVSKSAGVTLRTPGDDLDLLAGFLFTEGIVADPAVLKACRFEFSTTSLGHKASVYLPKGHKPDLLHSRRLSVRASSCSACGKVSLEALRAATGNHPPSQSTLSTELIASLPALLQKNQPGFHSTGGLHGAALLHLEDHRTITREDIGRHNAVDKVIGRGLLDGLLPSGNTLLFVSSRAGFEIIQKALVAGIPLVATVGAPSSLAIQTAQEADVTLLGFVRQGRCNVYSGVHRLAGISDAAISRVAS